ncbi:MAG: NAD(P)/FAD-dependent oxidoreductase [Bacteroidota bacterium]|nr:NAD(P)/FAD-dependent oxidoreductase [Bacteroidota bacterium]MDP3144801.1 NAD(P)/FAD-dependent oxidoreductase [Bacteroidota bacterium]
MKKIVIIGAGFAGLRLARKLKNKNFEVWLIDKNNYHQFQPLFYQVATSGLEPSSIAFPLRKVFQHYKNIHIRYAEVYEIYPAKKSILTSIGEINYDYLVIATGADTNFFGNQLVEKNALPMKSLSEALNLRNRILQNLENALVADKDTKAALLNIVIVGGGPTGVEVSGALAEMKIHVLPKDYPELDFNKMNIYLVEAGSKTLASMSTEASAKSESYLNKLGVNVLTSTQVTSYDGNEVVFSNGDKIKTKNLIWAAGVKGNLIKGLPENVIAKGNRIKVNRFNEVEGIKDVFALGDIAFMVTDKYPNGHPQVATVANNQADILFKNILNLQNQKTLIQFEYKDRGGMATVGRNLAVVDLPFLKFQGFFAWLFWMFLHLMLILGVKNKLLIFINWMWSYFTFDQSFRLIIKSDKK